MQYRCVATSPEGLVQQVAVCYLRHGYWWYVTGRIPKGKDPKAVDRKLVQKYGIDLTERQRAYRKQRGWPTCSTFVTGTGSCYWRPRATTSSNNKSEIKSTTADAIRSSLKATRSAIAVAASTPPGGGPPKWHACVRIDDPPTSSSKPSSSTAHIIAQSKT